MVLYRAGLKTLLGIAVLFLYSDGNARVVPQASTSWCAQDAAYHKLDFWIGNWDVFDSHDGSRSGTNKVQKIVEGCAIVEDWREADGSGEVKGFLYFQPARKQWKYVLLSPGGRVKERMMMDEFGEKGVRFQGEIPHPDGTASHLDRMTLFPLANRKIRETVEVSRDGGKSWETTFDGEYREQEKPKR